MRPSRSWRTTNAMASARWRGSGFNTDRKAPACDGARRRRVSPRTGASARAFAGQDVGRHHIGVRACGRATAARLLPVRLLAQQRLTEPVELGENFLRRCGDGLTSPFAEFLQLPGHLQLDVTGDLILGQGM